MGDWSTRRAFAVVGALLLATASCGDSELPPLPSAVIVVDTTLPVPTVVSRLRVDLYDERGTWFESSDLGRPDARDWPVSFGVFSDDESRGRNVWLRLRAYADGRVSPYVGERYRGWDRPFDEPPGDDAPRLLKAGVDVTPLDEPTPLTTVDRLVLVPLAPGAHGTIRVVLHGECVGTMVRLEAGRPTSASESCIDQPKQLSVVTASSPMADAPRASSQQGTFAAEPCSDGEAEDSPYVCVPGGGTIFGSTEDTPEALAGVVEDSSPVRVFGVRRFYMDRREVSVARFRAAQGRGLAGVAPFANERDTLDETREGSVSWSAAPRGREEYALTGIDQPAARRVCQFFGGDLPSEVQWEHAATFAGRPHKSRYVWGDEPPSCERAVYGRADIPQFLAPCARLGRGPRPIAESKDRTPLGVLGMGGGVSEWTTDAYVGLRADCWRDAPIVDPPCVNGAGKGRITARGGTWADEIEAATVRTGFYSNDRIGGIGFRCVYRERPRD